MIYQQEFLQPQTPVLIDFGSFFEINLSKTSNFLKVLRHNTCNMLTCDYNHNYFVN